MPQTRLLTRAPHHPDSGQPLLADLRLARARVHEAHGPARHMFAALLARAMEGPVFWVVPAWEGLRLYAPGMANLGLDPGRVTFVSAGHATDILWTLEECLRAGAIPLVVGELPGPPGLTAVRRMQLAAEAGAERGAAPVGLLLTPEGGTTGAESRWQMAPAHSPGHTGWTLTRERARADPPARWKIMPDAAGFALEPQPIPLPGA